MPENRFRTSRIKKRNPWKAAFLALLFTVILMILLLFGLITGWFSGGDEAVRVSPNQPDGAAIFTVQANKNQLETMINEQLSKQQDEKLSYHVAIGHQVTLNGSFKLLFTGIPFSITFNPKVSQGNIILKEADVELGGLKLPDEEVLSFLKSGGDFPKWVVIQPSKRQVYLDLSKIEIQDGMSVRAKTINLAEGNIALTIHQTEQARTSN
ncbi:DUF2140 family protein [Sporolactobacillus sp. THM7-7]|nr:DUF2140 family protein [Sporolactobacillus sp. THM7-7]